MLENKFPTFDTHIEGFDFRLNSFRSMALKPNSSSVMTKSTTADAIFADLI